MTLRIAACAAWVMLVPTAATASEWVEVASSGGGTQITYVDSSSIKRDGDIIRYWLKREYQSDPKGWARSTALHDTNCSTAQGRRLQLTVYFKDGTNISVSDPTPWEYVTPDTVDMAVHEFLCGG